MGPQVRLETTGAIATVTIDRPEEHNAVSSLLVETNALAVVPESSLRT